MSFPITAIYTAIFAIIVVPLSLQITMRRIALGNVAYGDGNDIELRRKVETLSNFSEYVPLGIILLAFFEMLYASLWVVLLGGLFLICRFLHAYGMLYKDTPIFRAVAMMGQHLYFLLLGFMLLYEAI